MPPGGKASPTRLKRRERIARAVELRKAGLTFAQVGQRLGISEATAHRMVTGELRRLRAQAESGVAELRELQLQQLQRVIFECWRTMQNDLVDVDQRLRAIDRFLKALDRQAKLLGLDAPVRQEVSGPGGGPIQTQNDDAAMRNLMSDPEAMEAMRLLATRQRAMAGAGSGGATLPAHPPSTAQIAQGVHSN